MPAPSKVSLLPEGTRDALNSRLIQGGFAGYEQLAEWLADEGFEISKSALHRYGQAFEERVDALKRATEQAKAIVNESPDDEGAMAEALTRLVSEKLFSVLLEMEIDPSKVNINSLGRTVAELTRASVAHKKYVAEVREKARAVAERVEKSMRAGGMSDQAAADIRREILGISE